MPRPSEHEEMPFYQKAILISFATGGFFAVALGVLEYYIIIAVPPIGIFVVATQVQEIRAVRARRRALKEEEGSDEGS